MPLFYAVFHININYSSIEKFQRKEVIERCYTPLLDIVEFEKVPLGIEATIDTLEIIEDLNPAWIARLRRLVDEKRAEIIASGYSQIIGPLVPWRVNRCNLELGTEGYERFFSRKPHIAYVNEQALSSSLLDVYLDAGYEAVMMEWDNPRSLHPEWPQSTLHTPVVARTYSQKKINVIWNWSIGFQKLQRVAYDQIYIEDYLSYINKKIDCGMRAVPLYGNDAEIFDFRPGRYREEAALGDLSEWTRIRAAFHALDSSRWGLPSAALERHLQQDVEIELTNAQHPVVVKKQKKYNLSRWGLSGRDDLWLNTRCFAELEHLLENGEATREQWQELCRHWASDYRTHITDARFAELRSKRESGEDRRNLLCHGERKNGLDAQELQLEPGAALEFDEARQQLLIASEGLELVLNMKRGGAIKSLRFSEQEGPVIGTLEHGHFVHIELGADFYSNHLVMELVTERRRVTDLEPATWSAHSMNGEIVCVVDVPTIFGVLTKTYRLCPGGTLECSFEFPFCERPEAAIRVGALTLLDTSPQAPLYGSHFGGREAEFWRLRSSVDYTQPASSLVSASSALGASEGVLWLGLPGRGVRVDWNPAHCAALPLLANQMLPKERMTRIMFSLVELDETFHRGGEMLPFSFRLSPWDGLPEKR